MKKRKKKKISFAPREGKISSKIQSAYSASIDRLIDEVMSLLKDSDKTIYYVQDARTKNFHFLIKSDDGDWKAILRNGEEVRKAEHNRLGPMISASVSLQLLRTLNFNREQLLSFSSILKAGCYPQEHPRVTIEIFRSSIRLLDLFNKKFQCVLCTVVERVSGVVLPIIEIKNRKFVVHPSGQLHDFNLDRYSPPQECKRGKYLEMGFTLEQLSKVFAMHEPLELGIRSTSYQRPIIFNLKNPTLTQAQIEKQNREADAFQENVKKDRLRDVEEAKQERRERRQGATTARRGIGPIGTHSPRQLKRMGSRYHKLKKAS